MRIRFSLPVALVAAAALTLGGIGTAASAATPFAASSTSAAKAAAHVSVVKKPKLKHHADGSWSVSAGKYTPSGGVVTYAWLVDGSPDGTTTSAHPAVAKPAGVAAVVTYVATSGKTHATTLVGRKGTPVVGTESIVGSHAGEALTLSNPTPFTTGATQPTKLSYQWYSNGKAISKATKSSWTPTTGYIGKTITAKVHVAATALFSAASVKTAGVTVGNFEFTGLSLTVTSSHHDEGGGVVTPGAVLTAVIVGTVPAGTTISYQWRNNIGDIAGATGQTYTVTDEDAGNGWDLPVRVTLTKPHYDQLQLFGSAGSANGWFPLVNKVAPKISGDATVGGTLSVDNGTWNDVDATILYSYQWFDGDTPIDGATSSTYSPTDGQQGDTLHAVVTATITDYTTADAPSDDVVVLGATAS